MTDKPREQRRKTRAPTVSDKPVEVQRAPHVEAELKKRQQEQEAARLAKERRDQLEHERKQKVQEEQRKRAEAAAAQMQQTSNTLAQTFGAVARSMAPLSRAISDAARALAPRSAGTTLSPESVAAIRIQELSSEPTDFANVRLDNQDRINAAPQVDNRSMASGLNLQQIPRQRFHDGGFVSDGRPVLLGMDFSNGESTTIVTHVEPNREQAAVLGAVRDVFRPGQLAEWGGVRVNYNMIQGNSGMRMVNVPLISQQSNVGDDRTPMIEWSASYEMVHDTHLDELAGRTHGIVAQRYSDFLGEVTNISVYQGPCRVEHIPDIRTRSVNFVATLPLQHVIVTGFGGPQKILNRAVHMKQFSIRTAVTDLVNREMPMGGVIQCVESVTTSSEIAYLVKVSAGMSEAGAWVVVQEVNGELRITNRETYSGENQSARRALGEIMERLLERAE
jgi:hypothetical protein